MEASKQNTRLWWGAVFALALLGFALRAYGSGESPAGDELTMYTLVHNRSFGSMMTLVVDQEKTPPLGFALSWLGSRLGPADTWMRAPSVLAGTALVPLVALLGTRTASRAAGLVAAALVAVSPFLLFYGIESRSYALAACFSCASLVLLLRATEDERPGAGPWVAWSVAALAAFLSHYTAVFVIAASIVWVLIARPNARKAILLSCGGIALALLPWLPSFLTQLSHSGDEARRVASLAPLGLSSVWEVLSRSLVGHPVWSSLRAVTLQEVPGTTGLVLILTGVGVATVSLAVQAARGERPKPNALHGLLLLTATASIVGLIIGSLRPQHSMLLPRNAICSLPSIAVLTGLLLTRQPKALALVVSLLVAIGLLLGSVTSLRDLNRPNMRAAAHAIEGRWKPGDALLESIYFNGPPTDLTAHLSPELRKQLQITREVGTKPFDQAVWIGQTVFTVGPVSPRTGPPLGPPANLKSHFKAVWTQTWKGLLPVTATEWQPDTARKR
ncbi:MAG: glycosyltransferase family 39 protein [Solirubrobacterales bacterium]|nr:glycosyltransferase family 39 protein [Solirubrobacterales bacterium]